MDDALLLPTGSLKDELRTVFLFQFLTEEQLDALCGNGRCTTAAAGTVCREGEPAQFFYVLLDGGDVVVSKRSGDNDVELHRTSERGTYFGAISDAVQVYDVSVRVTRPSRLFVVDAGFFAQFTRAVWPVAVHLLESSVTGGLRQRQLLGLQEKQHALATITAGLTHQLNNPAAAAVRAVADLRDSMAEAHRHLGVLARTAPQALSGVLAIQDEISALLATEVTLTPLETADREDALDDWFTDHGIADGWRFASTFVEAGLDAGWLDRIAAATPGSLPSAVCWLRHIIDIEMRTREIAEATARISTLVDGAKPYSQMDRGPYQCIDIHEMLRSTVLMFGDKIAMAGKAVTLIKDLDHTLPELHCYPADLNQVWTNLIDNALYAMNGRGTLTVRTRREGDAMIRVEICDDGPGIPVDIIDRIFNPFFTTKPVGEGPGLGLDLAWRIVVDRHGGHISVQSVPGDTRFIVCLPLEAPAPTAS
ncbi:histidine kinase [Mycolicibacterium murale]|uniref:histidine kinase n=1 Tax=Mycolicibacterium murale TaxID=182220 RepID=A0A7I9WL46_9MYCO|nr:ATP-binding protein [Mycolicibacterium murale]MCV7184875.1 histidine kinase [Mycolicibacterium murale]GFG58471.1 histidine kinase [Mycolicibacterium murale]